MSKRTSQPSQSSPPPASGVDFLVRTMIERESTGKRPIRPKNVEDLLQSTMQDESDDPDFDFEGEDSDSVGTLESDEGSNDSDKSGNENAQNSDDESEDEDYQGKDENEGASSSSGHDSDTDSDSSNNESQEGSDSEDEPDTTKKSALRETLEKLNESNSFMAKRPSKKKRKVVKKDASKPKKVSKKSAAKKPGTDSTKSKSATLHKSKSVVKKSKVSKLKVSSKKTKIGSKKIAVEKRKKKKGKRTDEKSKHRSILSLIDDAVTNQKENRKEIEVKKPICSACLGDKSDDANEIVECDSCGISVHEICYGLSADNLSVSSGSGSSSQTEPWFCDVCKSGSENIFCELCPVEGGLFKESTAGRWVHLVCALYTQGVVVHHDSSINLYELHYTRWGSHSCAACENERQALTGIVISCDAGMCKTYFHATCAQKLGLLSDPNQVDFAEADPYYVSCKMHTNRETMKRRIKLFSALQEQLRIKKERKEMEGLPSGANADQARIHRKLDKVRRKTALKRAHYFNNLETVDVPPQSTITDQIAASSFSSLPSSWTNGNKKQRLMHTSAKLGMDFLRKAEMLGEDIAAHELEVKHEKIVSNVKRKWNVLPAMSVEYAAYYADREQRITGLMDQYEKSVKENQDMMDKEIGLKDVWETQTVNQMAMAEETESVEKQLASLVDILSSVCPSDKKLATKLQGLVNPKGLSGTRRKSPSMSRGDRKSPTPRRSFSSKKGIKSRSRVFSSSSPSRAGKMAVAVCDTCSKSDGQHLITRCDKCGKHYHLGCLDPPLTRMPKRSRLCGWMCSDCCEAPSETEGQVDTEAPRTLRGRTKIHKPRKYRGSDESEDEKPEKKQEDMDSPKGIKKSPKANSSGFTSPEIKPSSVDLTSILPPISIRLHSSTPMERRRRSGSANLVTTPVSAACSPIIPLTSNGPSIVPELSSPRSTGKAAPESEMSAQIELKPIINEGKVVKTKAPRKSRAKVPKVTKVKEPKVQQKRTKRKTPPVEVENNSGVESGSPSKRKSLDGVVTPVKVNGISDTPLLTSEDTTSVKVKAKSSRSKKKKNVSIDLSSEQSVNVSTDGNNTSSEKVVKPKKPRKKKGDVSSAAVVAESSTDVIAEVQQGVSAAPSTGKVKKPRKKKQKEIKVAVDDTDAANTSGTPAPVVAVKKKSVKSKAAVPQVAATINASRDETNGVNLVMGKVTSQFIEDKLKSIQNGALKITKKRKSSTGPNASPSATLSTTTTAGTPNEKEKSVPPKKRKRVASSAQGQPNSVDSVIEAVSSGKFVDSTLLNGTCQLGGGKQGAEMSTVMQGVAPMNRPPEQKLMQGTAMGSGTNIGEMVTVDASFLLDAIGSNHSSYGVNSNSAKFYSGHQNCIGSSESGVLKLSSSGGASGSSENVIRLQYIDTPSVSISDSAIMPPPAPLASNSNTFGGLCATCTRNDSSHVLVKCDKCELEFHFACLNPPMKNSPRRKGHPWFCSDCDDGDSQLQENGVLPAMN